MTYFSLSRTHTIFLFFSLFLFVSFSPYLPLPLLALPYSLDPSMALTTMLASVTVTLRRVGPLKGGNLRTVLFTVNGKDQQHEVKLIVRSN